MQHSEQPYIELTHARDAIDEMRRSKTLADIEEFWKEYLRRIERAWNKSVSHFKKSPKWEHWHGRYVNLRRKDQLLAYLINARGADEHSIAEITKRESGGTAISLVRPGKVSMQLSIGPGGMNVKSDTDLLITEYSSRVRLLPVTNRGVVYDIPKHHLGVPIDPSNLVDIAENGLAFYDDFLKSAEKFFVEDSGGFF